MGRAMLKGQTTCETGSFNKLLSHWLCHDSVVNLWVMRSNQWDLKLLKIPFFTRGPSLWCGPSLWHPLKAYCSTSHCYVCLCILYQSCLTITAGTANCPILRGIGFQSIPPLEGAGVFNVPEGDSSQNTEPPFIAWFELLVSQTRLLASVMLDFSCGALERQL